MIKNYNDLIFKIIITIIFVNIFIYISNSNDAIIELGNSHMNSLVWIVIIVTAILVFSYHDKFIGTLLFILVLLHYKKFFKDPFSLHENFNIIKELFSNQQNENINEYDYAPYPEEIEYSLNKYPIPTNN
jgi:hypothetical protein